MPSDVPAIAAATFYASFECDVADTIDLTKLGRIAGESAEPAPLRLRTIPSPEQIQFVVPPLAANLASITIDGHPAATLAKIYDYGVVTIRFSFPFSGSWTGFATFVRDLRHGDRLANEARRVLQEVLQDSASALEEPHTVLIEDYFVYAIEQLVPPVTATTLLTEFQSAVVSLMMGEAHALSSEEQTEAVRLRFSYMPEDLVVVQWDSAFIYDTRANAEVLLDLFEFANSQLVEFRAYDARLDAELDAIYKIDMPRRVQWRPLQRRGADQRAEQLRYLLVDIRELADRASNALKIIGDAYYARVYRAISTRLGLEVWQRQIESKLDAVRDIYGYLIDQAQAARSEFLELIVILLIGIEIVVGILGLRH